jgi:membrane-bound lytic murein transglycosylase B
VPALAGAVLLSSVALVSHAVRVGAELVQHADMPSVAEMSPAVGVTAADRTQEAGATARQGGDLADVDAAPVARTTVARAADPVRPTGWYHLAAAEYGVSVQLLEALHQVESNASPDACIANLQGSGATGPFQFKPATFAQYGVDANHDGIVDICGFADSLFSAARYLRAIGADDDPTSAPSRRALVRYGTDADRVVSLARAYRERDGLLAMAPALTRE